MAYACWLDTCCVCLFCGLYVFDLDLVFDFDLALFMMFCGVLDSWVDVLVVVGFVFVCCFVVCVCLTDSWFSYFWWFIYIWL